MRTAVATGIGRAIAVAARGPDAATPAAVSFPTSPEAGHVTGQVVPVNGGAHLGR